MMDLEIKFVKTTAPKQKPADEAHLGFGKIFTDHMFIVEYTVGTGWHDARIVPYEVQLHSTVLFWICQPVGGYFVSGDRLSSSLISRCTLSLTVSVAGSGK